jgi:sarcosine oxidase
MLSVGPREGELISGILKSSAIHGLDATEYTSAEIRRTFPAFAPDEEHVGVFEPTAGWIDSNAALEAAQGSAKQYGASLRLDDPVYQWVHRGTHFEVTTASATVTADKLVITAGAWTSQLLQQLGLPLRVERKVLTWITPIYPALFQPPAFPVFAFSEGFLYDFPAIGDRGVKLYKRRMQNRPVNAA